MDLELKESQIISLYLQIELNKTITMRSDLKIDLERVWIQNQHTFFQSNNVIDALVI